MGYKTRNKIFLNKDLISRLKEFKNSKVYLTDSAISKSDYWQEQVKELTSILTEGSVIIGGDSGYYVPSSNSMIIRLFSKITKVLLNISDLPELIVDRYFKQTKLLSYKAAFDAVMSHAVISDPDLSPYRINHLELRKNSEIFPDAKSVSKHFSSWSGHLASSNIYLNYYYLNLLKGYTKKGEIRRVLEIGSGNGNFSSILYNSLSPVQCVIVDLPEMIPICAAYLSKIFPEAKIVLPNEVNKTLPKDYDFLFLTTTSIDLLPKNYIDLSVNCHSFQEMKPKQISVYFDLIQNVTKKNGYFFTSNRIEKIPMGRDPYTRIQNEVPNRFFEFPWKKSNQILINEISRFSRLVQLDAIGVRLERIRK
ncbi:putative sugar O-methyltransferase [Leptospira santarosai]|uniref:putative sugar O-methyltransferase n=1 Tax=Leptospira santarosai TaxID=28183 RepID=UPI000961C2A4|nr:putative sugar O-methyltransferase [Leptospira santarosai]ASV10813.1 putative sugar O-methyltransferase [Leptospira santarosai]MBW9232590.1 putative sugar O-methyltransferase [Leptospira santarosai]MDI7174392.1 putative sugar O-methyltransferase [Leptospira santarosai]MDI7193725.1 putative sugar O-methyltransferase [Leptospira santarosai]MDO6382069.1 putative sugar O-methyltransferase [Leptospira santarosai]